MKILIVCQHYYPEPFTVTSIAEELAKRGHEVTVLTSKPSYGFVGIAPGYENVDFERLNNVDVYRVDIVPRESGRFSIIRNYLSFWRHAKRKVLSLGKFDVVYSMSLSPIIMVSPAIKIRRKQNIPVLLHCLDLWPESVLITNALKRSNPLYEILKIWSKYIYKRCDKILLSSPSFKDYFSSYLKLSYLDMAYVPQPAFLPHKNKEDIVYKDPTFVYCGNIGKLQLVSEIINGFSLLKGTNAKLIIIGMGSEAENVKTLIKTKKLEDKVIYLGPKRRDEACLYFKNSKALIVSLKEGGSVGKTIPNKLITSLYYGKPILGIISGDGKDILEKAKGTIFAKEDTESIKNAFATLLSMNEAELNNLGKNNKEYYDKNFSFEKIVDEIETNLRILKKK